MSNEKNLFEIATRERYRFQFKGLISVEDLWSLSVKELDSIFKSYNAKLKESQEESLLDTKTKTSTEIENKIEIIKHIVAIKLKEEKEKVDAKIKKEKKQRILELINSKQEADLQNKSIEELQAMLNDFD